MAFWERMEKALSKGIETSKEVLEAAREKAKDLGDKGLLKYEILQLEKQAEKRFTQLGTTVYETLVREEHQTVSKSTAKIKVLLQDIEDIEQRINEREQALRENP